MIGKILVSMAVVGASSAAITGGKQLMDSAKALTRIQSQMLLQAGQEFTNPESTYTMSDDSRLATANLQALAAGKFDQVKQQ